MKKRSHTADTRTKPIVIAGSAGFVGRHIMRRLSQDGRQALSLYHTHLPEPLSHVKPIFIDILRPQPLQAVLQQADSVLYLAWSRSFKTWSETAEKENLENTPNIQMVRNFVHAMEEAGGKRIVFLSALGASRYATSWFLREKYAAESVILNSSIPEKVIVRTSLVYSKLNSQDRLLHAIERLMRIPWFYPVPKHEEKLAPIHVDDLNRILLYLLDTPLEQANHVLEVAGGESLDIEEIFRLVSQGIGKGGNIPLKGAIGSALTPLFERLQTQARRSSPSLRDMLSVGNFRDQATQCNNPLVESLPSTQSRLQDFIQQQPTLPPPNI